MNEYSEEVPIAKPGSGPGYKAVSKKMADLTHATYL